MGDESQTHGLGRTCPRCKKFTTIFSGIDLAGVHMLPVKGKFSYPCVHCSWAMECDTRLLEETKSPKRR